MTKIKLKVLLIWWNSLKKIIETSILKSMRKIKQIFLKW